MQLQFKYNKVSLQQIEKGLKIRLAALPTIRAKESALRNEVKKLRQELQMAATAYQTELDQYAAYHPLWTEWDERLLQVKTIHTKTGRFAGVSFPQYEYTEYTEPSVSFFNKPLWFLQGLAMMKQLIEKQAAIETQHTQVAILEAERRKTTQKLNLYEKVQIPQHEEAITKIKRYLEDEDSLSKAAQKLIKQKRNRETENEGTG